MGNQPGDTSFSIEEVSLDQISIDLLLTAATEVSVQVGNSSPTTLQAQGAGPHSFAVPFNNQTGEVTVTLKRTGKSVKGPGISTDCSAGNGLVNFNAIVEGS